MSDDPEKQQLKQLQREVERLKEEQKKHAEASSTKIFWAAWMIPLVVMQLAVPDSGPAVGSWFLGFPLAYWFYNRFMKDNTKD